MDGRTFEATANHAWILNKNALAVTVDFRRGGQRVGRVKEWMYWAPSRERIEVLTLTSKGAVIRGRVTTEGEGKCVQRKAGWLILGEGSVTIQFSKQGEDEIQVKFTQRMEEKDPQSYGFVFQRIEGATSEDDD